MLIALAEYLAACNPEPPSSSSDSPRSSPSTGDASRGGATAAALPGSSSSSWPARAGLMPRSRCSRHRDPSATAARCASLRSDAWRPTSTGWPHRRASARPPDLHPLGQDGAVVQPAAVWSALHSEPAEPLAADPFIDRIARLSRPRSTGESAQPAREPTRPARPGRPARTQAAAAGSPVAGRSQPCARTAGTGGRPTPVTPPPVANRTGRLPACADQTALVRRRAGRIRERGHAPSGERAPDRRRRRDRERARNPCPLPSGGRHYGWRTRSNTSGSSEPAPSCSASRR
jgi:hypothetical protein